MNDVNHNDITTSRRLPPPYLGVARIDRLMQLVENRNLNEVGTDYFKNQQFNSTDSVLAFSMLKFLGLVGPNGKATDLMRKMQLRGDAGTAAKKEIIKGAYSELFDRAPTAHELSRDELLNEIMDVYRVSPRVASAAAPAFLKLSEYAGLREVGTVQSKSIHAKRERRDTKATTVPAKRPDSTYLNLSNIDVVPEKLILLIPRELSVRVWSDDVLNEDLRALTKKIKEFGEQHLKSQPIDENGA
ncbi:MAG TPA: DUF5343 domain-containing protein [Candidatus Paceibacterota bacterium]